MPHSREKCRRNCCVFSRSPPGRGAIHVVYVTGPDALAALATLFRGASLSDARARYGRFVDVDGEVIDDGLVIPTGDGYLLTLHGNPLLVERLGEALCGAGGEAREVSPWAAAGRSPVAAEAVELLPLARTVAAAGFLLEQARDGLAAWEQRVRTGAHAPDPKELARMLADAPRGRALFEPRQVVLAGVPNAGKSTLFNALLGERRVVTHATPGTTRDVVREEIKVGAYPVRLLDGAGVRESDDPVEREGIERMARAIGDSDLVVLLEPPYALSGDADAARVMAAAVAGADRAGRLLRVRSRADEDLDRGHASTPLGVSGVTGDGIPELVAEIARRLFGGPDPPTSSGHPTTC